MVKKLRSKADYHENPSDEKFRGAPWLNPEHPNFERWKRARDLSIERGQFVKSIIGKHVNCENLNVLDLGSGEGGTSIIFSPQNKVFSYDLNPIRLTRQNDSTYYYKINGDALTLPFKDNTFDLIILQDVVEHLTDIDNFINEINKVLKDEGFIYLSTPNKYSIFNIIADPHWGFPVVSILKRKNIKSCFLQNFRKDEANRKDIPQLLSLREILKYFGNYFKVYIETRHAVAQLLSGVRGIVWSDFHLYLINLLDRLKIGKIVLLLVNNNKGIINKYFNPTFYLVMKKMK